MRSRNFWYSGFTRKRQPEATAVSSIERSRPFVLQLVEHLADVVGVDLAREEALQLLHRERLGRGEQRGLEHALHVGDVRSGHGAAFGFGAAVSGWVCSFMGSVDRAQAIVSVARSALSFT